MLLRYSYVTATATATATQVESTAFYFNQTIEFLFNDLMSYTRLNAIRICIPYN